MLLRSHHTFSLHLQHWEQLCWRQESLPKCQGTAPHCYSYNCWMVRRRNFSWILWFRLHHINLKFRTPKWHSCLVLFWPYLCSWAKNVLPTTSVISSFFLSEKRFCHEKQVCVFSSAFGWGGVAKVRDGAPKDWNVGLSLWFTGLLTRTVFKLDKKDRSMDRWFKNIYFLSIL